MADRGGMHDEPRAAPGVRTAARTLSVASDQEALELDVDQNSPFPTRTAPSLGSNKFSRWWKRHIFLTVPHVACRDHLANERTFLGYLRTGQAFAMFGVIIAQMMRIQHSLHPNPTLGFFVISVPLSSVCHASAIAVSLLGAIRYVRVQNEMARGYAAAGGWETTCVGILTALVVIVVFILAVAITIDKN